MNNILAWLLGLVVGTVGAPPHYYLGAAVLCQVEVPEVQAPFNDGLVAL